MPLEIIPRTAEGIQILDLKGQLTLGPEDLEFRAEFDRLISAGTVRVALNFEGLRDLDSTGLSTLIAARAALRKAGGELAMFAVNGSHLELLTEAHLEISFEMFPDQQSTIDSFFPEGESKGFDILEFVESQKKKAT